MSQQTKKELLEQLYEPFRQCITSPLHIDGNTNIIFGEGNPDADILFIGEAPGQKEDEQGRPFVGRSGQLLNKLLNQIGLDRKDVYITNIVKCRPKNNRTPNPQEIKRSKELILVDQINIIQPKIICTLGASALRGLFEKPFGMTKTRGKIIYFHKTPVIPTFHPAYVLRNPSAGKHLLEDLIKAKALAEKTQ